WPAARAAAPRASAPGARCCWRGCGGGCPASAVDVPHDEEHAAEDRNHVGHEGAPKHMRGDADVRERRGADLHPVRPVAAVGDEVVAELHERVLGVTVDLAL